MNGCEWFIYIVVLYSNLVESGSCQKEHFPVREIRVRNVSRPLACGLYIELQCKTIKRYRSHSHPSQRVRMEAEKREKSPCNNMQQNATIVRVKNVTRVSGSSGRRTGNEHSGREESHSDSEER